MGLRFSGLAVPPGAAITNAYVQFQVDEPPTSESTTLTLSGQAVDTAPGFSATSGDISSRPATQSSAVWSPAAWDTVGQAGAGQRTPDISAIVQEIIDRPGWQSGNALALIITGSGQRVAVSYDGTPGAAPLLHVEYTTGGSGSSADLIIKDITISDTRTYDSDAGIIFDNVVMTATADVVAASTFELQLKPGTRIAQGARFVARMKDNDGLSNRCEMQYFGNLNQDPDGDFDGDGYTNLQECQVGTDPASSVEDTDGDGLPDFWEMQHFGDLDRNCNSDSNGDGVYDCIEYQLGRDPNAIGSKGPGIYYQYDELGRIRKIERIPSR